MTQAIDFVKFCREILKRLSDNDIRIDDYRYVDMYNEYRELESHGLKKEYIRKVLAERYGISESTVFRVISRLEKCVKT